MHAKPDLRVFLNWRIQQMTTDALLGFVQTVNGKIVRSSKQEPPGQPEHEVVIAWWIGLV